MRKVQSSEAKTHFPRLLDDVENGETIAITRHGRVVARLVPEKETRHAEVLKAIEDMEKLRASLPKTGLTVEDILEMRHEGHKY